MARPGFVLPRDERIDDSQLGERADRERRDSTARAHAAVVRGRVFERANHGRPDGNDPSVPLPHGIDRIGRPRRDLIRFGEREHRIEARIPGGGNPRGVRQGRERRSAGAKAVNESPIEEKPCGRRFEGDRAAGDRRPGVPQCQWIREIRVLNRAPVPRQPFPNLLSRTLEAHLDQPGMLQDGPHDGTQRA